MNPRQEAAEARRDGDPKGGQFQDKVEQGRYGLIFPKTPASDGFSIVAKIIPGREGRLLTNTPKASRKRSLPSRTRWLFCSCMIRAVLLPIRETPTRCQGTFDTDFDKYTEDAVTLFGITGLRTGFKIRKSS